MSEAEHTLNNKKYQTDYQAHIPFLNFIKNRI